MPGGDLWDLSDWEQWQEDQIDAEIAVITTDELEQRVAIVVAAAKPGGDLWNLSDYEQWQEDQIHEEIAATAKAAADELDGRESHPLAHGAVIGVDAPLHGALAAPTESERGEFSELTMPEFPLAAARAAAAAACLPSSAQSVGGIAGGLDYTAVAPGVVSPAGEPTRRSPPLLATPADPEPGEQGEPAPAPPAAPAMPAEPEPGEQGAPAPVLPAELARPSEPEPGNFSLTVADDELHQAYHASRKIGLDAPPTAADAGYTPDEPEQRTPEIGPHPHTFSPGGTTSPSALAPRWASSLASGSRTRCTPRTSWQRPLAQAQPPLRQHVSALRVTPRRLGWPCCVVYSIGTSFDI